MSLKDIKSKYKYPLDNFDRLYIEGIVDKGKDAILLTLVQHLSYIDCTKTDKQGYRIIQTINENYKWEISRYIAILESLKDIDEEAYKASKAALINRHEDNLKFEETTPPIVYDNQKAKKNTTRKRKVKEGDLFPKEVKPKVSKAEAKLKAKLLGASLGFGSFKLKKD